MSGECDKCGEHCLDCKCFALPFKECLGVFGNIFGHSFKNFLKKEQFIQHPSISFDVQGSENVKTFMDSQRNIYSIRCKRCGLELD